ncbi:unnamed protein product [Nippostrongylus brasiliensis]|uniref:NGFI-A-binding protein homolog (inferred by orthology to a D. melanogaster protein) n=1 Tax=Nippostrongylus brasiliensis TaxID=27835 RepID=A0A0N4YTP8_NIPBR|nr:unnamed protein product [Nippostrongylus brasiliensis]
MRGLPRHERPRLKKLVRIGTLNVGTLTGKAREFADLMRRKNIQVLCLQETRWEGEKAKEIGDILTIAGDLNGHVGEERRGMERVHGGHGIGTRNDDGERIVDLANAHDPAICNTFFAKWESQKVIYSSGGRKTEIDYILIFSKTVKLRIFSATNEFLVVTIAVKCRFEKRYQKRVAAVKGGEHCEDEYLRLLLTLTLKGAGPLFFMNLRVKIDTVTHVEDALERFRKKLTDFIAAKCGDDINQIMQCDEGEFLEIMSLVGMLSKPLHVRRLQRALTEFSKDQTTFNLAAIQHIGPPPVSPYALGGPDMSFLMPGRISFLSLLSEKSVFDLLT